MRSAQEEIEYRDPMKVASNVAGLLMENDRVRVIRGFLKPGEKAAMHSHPDHIVYVAQGGKIQMAYPSGKAEVMDLETGKAMFMQAQAHEVVNIGDTEVEFIVTELK